VLVDLVRNGGGISRLVLHRENSLRYNSRESIVERIESGPPLAPELLERMNGLLDERDGRGIISLLDDTEGASTEEQHE